MITVAYCSTSTCYCSFSRLNSKENSQIIADDYCLLFYWLIISRSLFCVVTGPSGPVNLEFDPRDGKGHFMAKEYGMHEVIVTNEGEAVKGAPNYIR
jgi:hypothetical protein